MIFDFLFATKHQEVIEQSKAANRDLEKIVKTLEYMRKNSDPLVTIVKTMEKEKEDREPKNHK